MASEAVKVIVRCRPMNEREKALGCKVLVSRENARGQRFLQNPAGSGEPPKQFTFDGAYCQQHRTEQIYDEIAYPLVEGVTEGYNGTIFAYGQTGSGKSSTMQGAVAPSAQKGVIPRALEHIFESVQCAENAKFLVRASYLEIYNEDIQDLLGADTKQKLELKEHPEQGVYVKGLSLHTVHSVLQCERIMETGWRNRAVACTLMNKDSSRSHSIFTVNMEICTRAVSVLGRVTQRLPKLWFQMLATHSNAEFASVAALLAHYSAAPGGCFCRLAPGRRNPGYEERDPGGGAWGEAAWAPAAPVGAQHEQG